MLRIFAVLKAGLEPARTNVHWILSPTCLPIPPLQRNTIIVQSERRDLNPRPSPWQGDALPLSYFRNKAIYLKERLSQLRGQI